MYSAPVTVPSVARKGVLWMVIAHGASAVIALPAPTFLVALAAGSLPGAWMLFREGGVYAWLTAGLFFLTTVALGVLGGFFLAGRKLPGSVLYAVALAPFIAGITGAAMNYRFIRSLLGGEASIDPGQKARIFAAGTGEAESTIVLGATMTALAMLLVALASLFRVLSLDASTIDPGRTRRSGMAMAATAGAMVLALILAVVARGVLHHVGHPLSLLVLVGSIGVGVLAASRAPLAPLVDREDANTFRTLVLLAFASASSVLFASVAAYAMAKGRALGAISGASVDASQKARILAETLEEMRAARVIGLVDFALLLLGFAVPAISSGAARGGLRPRPSLAAWAAMLLLTVGTGVAQARLIRKGGMAFQATDPALMIAGLEVPTSRETWEEPRNQVTFYVPRDGRLLVDLSLDGKGPPVPATEGTIAPLRATARRGSYDEEAEKVLPAFSLVVDRNVTYGALKTALTPLLQANKVFSLVLAPAPEQRIDRSALGDLAYFVGSDGKSATLRFFTASAVASDTEPEITIVTDGPTATMFSRKLSGAVALSMTPDATASRRDTFSKLADTANLAEIGIAPKDDDTLQTIWQLADEARSAVRSAPRLVLSNDRRTNEQREAEIQKGRELYGVVPPVHGRLTGVVPRDVGSVRMGAVQVNGRLPPEVITRIVRQNFGRFRLCYENGLRTDPHLQGRVSVKFVIDRSGAVASAANGGSDLPSESVISCVVRSFSSLSFPQPEGGIVTVVYPIMFTPPEK